jgi:hypothetical protein
MESLLSSSLHTPAEEKDEARKVIFGQKLESTALDWYNNL